MNDLRTLLGSAALIALISGSGAGVAMAQTDSETDQTQSQQNQTQTAPSGTESPAASGQNGSQSGNQQTGDQQSGDQQSGDQQAGSGDQSGEDRLIAKVNDVEIRQSDVVTAIENLPPQVQQMPQQMLVPIVVDQLLTRELILEQGQTENLQTDPAVVTMIEEQTQALEDLAVVNVWIERELAERITEERIEEAFERFQSANPDSTVTMEDARPQLEQALRQEVMKELAAELREDAAIVFYDASGNPLPENQAGSATGQNQQTGQDAGTAGETTGSTSSAPETESQSD